MINLKIDEKAIENIDGVKGQFFAAAQYQIILGTGFVNKVYDVIIKQTGHLASNNKAEAYAQMSLSQKNFTYFRRYFRAYHTCIGSHWFIHGTARFCYKFRH